VTIEELGGVLLFGAAVLLVAITAVRISSRTGLPSLLLYLGLGMLLGESGLGIHFDDAHLTGVLGYCALILILAEGGLTTRWEAIRPSIGPAAVLATVGTLASVLVTAAFTRMLFQVDWTLALLLGAVLSSTDAAAVFSVLRRVPLPSRLAGLLEAESGFNDAPVVIVVVALTEAAQDSGHALWWLLSLEAVAELAIGLLVGLGVGALGAQGLRRIALPSSGLYPIAVLGLIAVAYGAGVTLHGSGFLAVYVSSLVLGNVRLPHGAAVRGFAEGLGWLAQIGLFVLLGLIATPQRLADQIVPAILIGLVLLVVARPVSILVSTAWFRFPWREQMFLSWAGLRGAVPIVLATIPMAGQIPNSTQLFDLVFVLVVLFTLVQAPSLPWVARRLRISADLSTIGLDVESAPLGALDADVMLVRIGPTSRLHGVELFELRLPEGSNITLVIRDGLAFVPEPRTVFQHGDDLILVTAAAVRGPTEKRLQEISAAGKLAGWVSTAPSTAPRKDDKPPWFTARGRLRWPPAYTWHSKQ
jgi:potassium/hydrogen antiporter